MRKAEKAGVTSLVSGAIRMMDREGKYLTFALGQEEYGIGILKAKKIIPLVDLGLKFGME